MAESVQTGGVMQFRHDGAIRKLDDERKRAIERGYREAAERKEKERRRRVLWWVVAILIVFALVIIVVLSGE